MKTRLAATIGRDQAIACYRDLLSNTLQCATAFDSTVYIEGPVLDRSWLQGLPFKHQVQGDLGQRMLACFQDGVQVLIGGDSPLMTTHYLEAAFVALQSYDLVLGPTEDGGYVLIGMHEPIPALFNGVKWGTSEVLSATIEVADQLGLRVKCLQSVWDVDTESDYARWRTWKEKTAE